MNDSSRKLVVAASADEQVQLLVASLAEPFKVELASDGHLALGIANRHKPAAVVVDVDLPVISGLEVAKLIRRKFTVEAPFLIGLAKPTDGRAIESGLFVHVVEKPIDVPGLVGLLVSRIG